MAFTPEEETLLRQLIVPSVAAGLLDLAAVAQQIIDNSSFTRQNLNQITPTDGFLGSDLLLLRRGDRDYSLLIQYIIDAINQQIIPLFPSRFPVGTIMFHGATNPPDSFLICNGASLNRSAYPELFSAIGTAWGSSSSTTFNLPDLRGLFPRVWDQGRELDSGRGFATTQGAGIPNLNGWIASYAMGRPPFTDSGGVLYNGGGYSGYIGSAGNRDFEGLRISFASNRQITETSEVRPVNIAVQAIIKALP